MASSSALKNIALGKPYTMNPQPNYPYCTDPGDKTQLTDGKYTAGYFCTQKSTVGWGGVKYTQITIDLGAVHAISGVSFNTAAGVAGVQWPSAIDVLVSDDGRSFYDAGDLVVLSRKNTPVLASGSGYQVHRYWTHSLETRGRYVSLVVFGEPYIFVDEIEVYEGVHSDLAQTFSGAPVHDFKEFALQKRINNLVKARLRDDIQGIRAILNSANVSEQNKKNISTALLSVENKLMTSPDVIYNKNFRAVMPLNPLHERIYQIQAQLWRALGLPQLTLWQSGLWGPLTLVHVPVTAPEPEVKMDMMLNEYRAGEFNISNASDKEMTLRMSILGLPGGTNPSYITAHEVAWTGTSNGECFSSALPEAQKEGGTFLIHVPSGLTRQVWFTFHPEGMSPGIYNGVISLSGGEKPQDLPVILHIYPIRFPDHPTLHLGGWDYTDADSIYDVTPQNRDKIIAFLHEYFVDSPWGTSSVLPFGHSGGKGAAPPDTTRFDTWIKRWPDAHQYCTFIDQRQLAEPPYPGTPAFAEKVKRWITFWADHARQMGIRPDQLNILIIDEPSTPKQDEMILQWARAIHAAGTGVKVWEDPVHKDILQANQRMLAECDVICPNRWQLLNPSSELVDLFNQRKKQGKGLALYSCLGPARDEDPYTYYRLQAWACWELGATSSYFWAFTDTGGVSSWNEYSSLLDKKAYSPFFIDAATITAGKHMEAIREGVEDYEYLLVLQDKISKLKKCQNGGELFSEACKLLIDAPKQVLSDAAVVNSSMWAASKNRNLADDMRKNVLDMLVALQKYNDKTTSTIGD